MRTEYYLKLVEFVLWVVSVAALVVAIAFPVGWLVGGDLVAGKVAVFVAGVALFGAGTLAIQPSGPNLDGSVFAADSESEEQAGLGRIGGEVGQMEGIRGGSSDDDPEHRYEARLHEIGPLADHNLPFECRVSRGTKIFATSLVVLSVSLLMEIAGLQI